MFITLLRHLGRRKATSQLTPSNQRGELAQSPCDEVEPCGTDFHAAKVSCLSGSDNYAESIYRC